MHNESFNDHLTHNFIILSSSKEAYHFLLTEMQAELLGAPDKLYCKLPQTSLNVVTVCRPPLSSLKFSFHDLFSWRKMQAKLQTDIINILLCFSQHQRLHDCVKVQIDQRKSCHVINIIAFLFITLLIGFFKHALSFLEKRPLSVQFIDGPENLQTMIQFHYTQ